MTPCGYCSGPAAHDGLCPECGDFYPASAKTRIADLLARVTGSAIATLYEHELLELVEIAKAAHDEDEAYDREHRATFDGYVEAVEARMEATRRKRDALARLDFGESA